MALRDLARAVIRRAGLPRSASVGYIGFLGRGNLGDEVMFAAIQGILSGVRLEPFCGRRREWLLERLGQSGGRCFGRVVLGGGTLINVGYLPIVRLALDMGIATSSFGTGVGSCGFGAPPHEDLTAWVPVLRRFAGLGVRGPRSAAALRALGLDGVEVIGDPALALTPPSLRPVAGDGYYLLSVALPDAGAPDFPVEALVRELASLVRRLERLGWAPVPVALAPGDDEAVRQVLARAGLSLGAARLLTSHAAFCAAAEPCAFAVGVRLHSAVLACTLGLPPVLIAYRSKCQDFMESMGLERWMVDPDSMRTGELAGLAATLAEEAAGLRQGIQARARFWQRRLWDYAARNPWITGSLRARGEDSGEGLTRVRPECADSVGWRP